MVSSRVRAATQRDGGLFVFGFLGKAARSTRVAALALAAACAAGLASSASAQELPDDETILVDPNFYRGPVRVSIDAIRARYADGSFNGGALFQQALRRQLPVQGTFVSAECGTTWFVGMRVTSLVDNPNGMPCVLAGEEGVVMSAADTGELLVGVVQAEDHSAAANPAEQQAMLA